MELFGYIVIPLLIFISRIVDVSLGTIRILLISKGKKLSATGLGFIESAVWLLAIREILGNLDNVISYIAYPAGYAAGTYVGMLIEERFIKGKVILRVIVKKDLEALLEDFKEEKQNYTILEGEGLKGNSKILFVVLNQEKINSTLKKIKKHNPNAFYTLESLKYARDPIDLNPKKRNRLMKYRFFKKGK